MSWWDTLVNDVGYGANAVSDFLQGKNQTVNNAGNALGGALTGIENQLGIGPGSVGANVLAATGGVGVSSDNGFHQGMSNPVSTSPQPDYNQIVDNATGAYNASQPTPVITYDSPVPSPNREPDSTGSTYHQIGEVNGTNAAPHPPLVAGAYNPAAPPPPAPIAGQVVNGTGGARPADTSPQPGANPLAWQDWIAQHPAEAAGIFGSAVGGLASGVGSVVAANTQANAATEAAKAQVDAANRAVDLQRDQLNQQRTDALPWMNAGKTALGQLGDLTSNANWKSFGADQFQQDPGYQFRLSEGMKALQNSAAARGQLFSGNTMKGVTNYAQGAASDEYNNAFNRYQTERNSRLNSLQSLAGVGQTATQQVGQAGQNYATNAGNALIGGGNAQAGGITGAGNANASGWVGGANALTNALSSGINTYNSNRLLNSLIGKGT